MAGELVKTKYTDSEVSKTSDFQHTADSTVEILQSLFDGAFSDVTGSFVVSGMSVTQMSVPSMNVQINSGLAFHRGYDKLLHIASAISVPVSPAHATQDRIDTVEIKYEETDFDPETRAFKDPASGVVQYTPVNTKKKVSVQARCLEGLPGGSAPNTEAGWMKLAEVVVASGALAIFSADIHGITALVDASNNETWTNEKQAVFNLKSLATIKKDYLEHVALPVSLVSTAHGIRQGSGNGFDADKLDGMHAASAATVSTVVARDADGGRRLPLRRPTTTSRVNSKWTRTRGWKAPMRTGQPRRRRRAKS